VGRGDGTDVLVCTPVYRAGSYVLDRFLSNQREIQERFPACALVLATVEDDFVAELEGLLSLSGLSGEVITYLTAKPDYARSGIWDTTSGRNALREHMLSRTHASYMLCLDADMTYDPGVIGIMLKEIPGRDLVHSGYALRNFGIGLSGTGCTLMTRALLERLRFRCFEFKNGHVIPEDLMLEVDMFKLRRKARRGFFVANCHYRTEAEVRCITPRPVGLLRRMSNAPLPRYLLISASVLLRYNITLKLKYWYNRLAAGEDVEDPFKIAGT
jgi:hypothetical protein